MLDAKKFAANFRPVGPTVCNSEHPLWLHILDKRARKVPGNDDLFYIRSNSDKWVATYRPSKQTVSVWNYCFEEFKVAVKKNEHRHDLYTVKVELTDKYIGNAILRYLRAVILWQHI